MRKEIGFFIAIVNLAFCFELTANAQNDSIIISNEENWIIKFSPLNLLDPVNPAVQVGVERFLTKKTGLQIDLGYIIPCTFANLADSVFPDYKGFKVRMEYRYYAFMPQNLKMKFYLAPEVYFTRNKGYSSERFLDNTLGSVYDDEFGFKKIMYGLNLKIGFQKRIKHFIYDIYVGEGVKHKHTTHFDRIDPSDEMYNPELNMSNYTNIEMNGWVWNGPLFNFKIGYILR